jgi:hypothetical protein
MNQPFAPRQMLWNGVPFLIEQPAVCYRGYDLDNVSLEDYFPDLHKDWNRHIKDIPFDEIQYLSILELVGLERTLQIAVMLEDIVPNYPDRLDSSDTTAGWHPGGIVTVNGQLLQIKGVHIAPTEKNIRSIIQAARTATETFISNVQSPHIDSLGTHSFPVQSISVIEDGLNKILPLLHTILGHVGNSPCVTPTPVHLTPGETPSPVSRPIARVHNDYRVVVLPSGGSLDLGRKHKRRAFLRYLASWAKSSTTNDFFWETLKEDYNRSLAPSQSKMKISSDRLFEDLFKRQNRQLAELISIVDNASGIYRLIVDFVDG